MLQTVRKEHLETSVSCSPKHRCGNFNSNRIAPVAVNCDKKFVLKIGMYKSCLWKNGLLIHQYP